MYKRQVQSIGTFLFVSFVFAVLFALQGIPVYLAFIFGGIALATACLLYTSALAFVTLALVCSVPAKGLENLIVKS